MPPLAAARRAFCCFDAPTSSSPAQFTPPITSSTSLAPNTASSQVAELARSSVGSSVSTNVSLAKAGSVQELGTLKNTESSDQEPMQAATSSDNLLVVQDKESMPAPALAPENKPSLPVIFDDHEQELLQSQSAFLRDLKKLNVEKIQVNLETDIAMYPPEFLTSALDTLCGPSFRHSDNLSRLNKIAGLLISFGAKAKPEHLEQALWAKNADLFFSLSGKLSELSAAAQISLIEEGFSAFINEDGEFRLNNSFRHLSSRTYGGRIAKNEATFRCLMRAVDVCDIDVNQIRIKGLTLLACAVKRGCYLLALLLLKKGADPALKSTTMKSVKAYAEDQSCVHTLRLIKSARNLSPRDIETQEILMKILHSERSVSEAYMSLVRDIYESLTSSRFPLISC